MPTEKCQQLPYYSAGSESVMNTAGCPAGSPAGSRDSWPLNSSGDAGPARPSLQMATPLSAMPVGDLRRSKQETSAVQLLSMVDDWCHEDQSDSFVGNAGQRAHRNLGISESGIGAQNPRKIFKNPLAHPSRSRVVVGSVIGDITDSSYRRDHSSSPGEQANSSGRAFASYNHDHKNKTASGSNLPPQNTVRDSVLFISQSLARRNTGGKHGGKICLESHPSKELSEEMQERVRRIDQGSHLVFPNVCV